MTTLERLREIIAEQFTVAPVEIHGESTLADFGADSLDNIEIQISIDEEFGIDLPGVDFDECKNIAALAAVIESNLPKT